MGPIVHQNSYCDRCNSLFSEYLRKFGIYRERFGQDMPAPLEEELQNTFQRALKECPARTVIGGSHNWKRKGV